MQLSEIKLTGKWVIAGLLALVLVTYLPAMLGGYIWDDDDYVTENDELRTSEGLRNIWLDPAATPQYYPMVFTSFWIEHQLWGLQPAGYHIVNILLHAFNAVLLFRVLEKLKVPGAAFAAAWFAVAPVHVESVAWISERKNVLSGMLYLSSFLAYWRFAAAAKTGQAQQSDQSDSAALESRSAVRWLNYGLSLLLFALALLSKSVTCSLPAAILLVVWWKEGRLTIRNVAPLVPMFAIGVAAGINTILMEKNHVGAQGVEWQWSLLERVLIAGRVLWFYAGKLVWPQPLVFIYPKWQIDATAWWQYLFVIAFVAVVVALWRSRNRFGRGPLVAVLYFAGTLFPALGFIDVYPMRFSFVADHFQYLASIGLIALFSAVATWATKRLDWHPLAGIVGAAVVLVFFVRVSFVRGFDYANAETIWRATLQDNPDCWMAQYNLGAIRFRQQRFEEAYQLLTASLQPRENDEPSREERADLYFYLGAIFSARGNIDRATAYYEQSRDEYLELAKIEDPPDAATFNNLGIVQGAMQRPEAAIEAFERALEIDPEQPEVRLNLGEMYFRIGQLVDSEACFRTVLETEPWNVRARYNLGTVAWSQGKRDEAIGHMRETLRQQPDYQAAQIFLQQAARATQNE